MTREEIVVELRGLAAALPVLTKAQEETSRALLEARERLDAIDQDQWRGKPSGALAGALSAVAGAEAENTRAKLALGANHRRRLELVRRLRALVAA